MYFWKWKCKIQYTYLDTYLLVDGFRVTPKVTMGGRLWQQTSCLALPTWRLVGQWQAESYVKYYLSQLYVWQYNQLSEAHLAQFWGIYRVRYDAVLIYKRRTEIWKDADFDTLPRDHFTKKRASFQSELAFSFTTVCRKLASFLRCFTKLLAFCDPENM